MGKQRAFQNHFRLSCANEWFVLSHASLRGRQDDAPACRNCLRPYRNAAAQRSRDCHRDGNYVIGAYYWLCALLRALDGGCQLVVRTREVGHILVGRLADCVGEGSRLCTVASEQHDSGIKIVARQRRSP